MFERFTERAREVVVLAQDEARALQHDAIDTEHLLLGLLREEEGLAARVLDAMEITIEEVSGQVVAIVGRGPRVVTGQIAFASQGKAVFEDALREALLLDHDYIGTEHILLGLVRQNESVASRVLLDFDADAQKIRGQIVRMLSGPARRAGSTARRRTATTGSSLFTPGSERVLWLAEEEARALNHVAIGTEHFLLGLLLEAEGLPARLLGALAITAKEVRASVIDLVGEGDEVAIGRLDFTPQAERVLGIALREARDQEGSIATEHILLGLLRVDDGLAARVLREYRR